MNEYEMRNTSQEILFNVGCTVFSAIEDIPAITRQKSKVPTYLGTLELDASKKVGIDLSLAVLPMFQRFGE